MVEEKMKSRRDRDVVQFWGRPLGEIDVQLREVLGWAKLVGKGPRKMLAIDRKVKDYEGQNYRYGALPTRGQLRAQLRSSGGVGGKSSGTLAFYALLICSERIASHSFSVARLV
jgi:hypothetical protein